MYKAKKILAIIPARAGSKRCPGKNTRLVLEKPLISWTIEAALQSALIDKILVSSDDSGVLAIASRYENLFVIERPKALATDEATAIDVIVHAIDSVEESFDYGILLQPTSPLRTSQDIDTAITQCLDAGQPTCVSFSELPKPANFYYASNQQGFYPINDDKLYIVNGAIYIFDLKYFSESKQLLNNKTMAYLMPSERSVDIDTELEFELAELLLRGNYASKCEQ